MRPKCGQNAAKVRPKCGQSAAKVRPKCGQSAAKVRPRNLNLLFLLDHHKRGFGVFYNVFIYFSSDQTAAAMTFSEYENHFCGHTSGQICGQNADAPKRICGQKSDNNVLQSTHKPCSRNQDLRPKSVLAANALAAKVRPKCGQCASVKPQCGRE